MFTFFKKKKTKPKNVEENGVIFAHHNPERGNIGDYLCSPRHYFNFIGPAKNLCIIGGGVFVDYGYKRLKKSGIKPQNSVLWATGISLTPEKQPSEKVNHLKYPLWGLRDIDHISDTNKFLPCSSCLHSMLDDDVSSNNTLLFINADPKITSENYLRDIHSLASKNQWTLLFNNCSEQELRQHFSQHSNIITNSYHGSYWGLLSGKRVVPIGYSTKFTSLMKAFNINPDIVVPYTRGCGDSLLSQLRSIEFEGRAIKLENRLDILADFRRRNIQFAEKMIAADLIERFELKH